MLRTRIRRSAHRIEEDVARVVAVNAHSLAVSAPEGDNHIGRERKEFIRTREL